MKKILSKLNSVKFVLLTACLAAQASALISQAANADTSIIIPPSFTLEVSRHTTPLAGDRSVEETQELLQAELLAKAQKESTAGMDQQTNFCRQSMGPRDSMEMTVKNSLISCTNEVVPYSAYEIKVTCSMTFYAKCKITN